MHSGSDNLDDLDDRVRDIAGLITHITTAAAFADRTVRRDRNPESDTIRLKVTQLTRAVGALGHALADLGEAVGHAGALHQLAASPRSTQRSEAIESTRALLHARIDSARGRLNKTGARLHQAADRLTAPPAPSRSTSPSVTTPRPRPSPAASRTR
ncbi:hypothetical protein BCL80_113120 [Streptomyces avidinii]|uniref:hypothetical protein n=1 Tax=[Kitasatospora] papulosa TaxID=1464011 RepID=UPI000BCA8232|nr:hypothetical protein BCL80_113120 [Streptomyces avidinii]WSZ50900.1 hypothetical protein OG337_27675 [[Kitasatospora] papulosa]SNX80751.1 hypothetical protein SAMN05421860_112120 [Streptomyces microflavus]